MSNQAIAGLEQPKLDLVLIQLQKLEELVQNVGLGQKVGAIIRTEQKLRSLNLLKHRTNLLLNFGGNCGRWIAVQSAQNVSRVLLLLRASQFLQDLTDVILIEFGNV